MRNLFTLLILALGALTAFAQGTTVTTRYQTVADMVAATIQNVPANTRLTALVTGRVSTNDGGGGVFFYDSSSAASTNLGTAFKPAASNGRWLRQYSGPVNLRWFGAQPSLASSVNTTAFTNAVTHALTRDGSIFVPAGVYRLDPVSITTATSKTSLKIAGVHTTSGGELEPGSSNEALSNVISAFSFSATNGICFQVGSGATSEFQGVTLQDLYFLGPSEQALAAPTATSVALYLDNSPYWELTDVSISHFHTGLVTTNSFVGDIDNVHIRLCQIGASFEVGSNRIMAKSLKTTQCRYGAFIRAGGALNFQSPWMEGSAGNPDAYMRYGFVIGGPVSADISGVTIQEPWFEQLRGRAVMVGSYDDRSSPSVPNIVTSLENVQHVSIIGGHWDDVGMDESDQRVDISTAVNGSVMILNAPQLMSASYITGTMKYLQFLSQNDDLGYPTFSLGASPTEMLSLTASDADIQVQTSNDADNTSIFLRRSRGTTSTPTIVAANDVGALLLTSGYDGANFIGLGSIEFAVDGTPGSNDMPGRLDLRTTADGGTSPATALRINNAQEVLIGSTTDIGGYKVQITGTSSLDGDLDLIGPQTVATTTGDLTLRADKSDSSGAITLRAAGGAVNVNSPNATGVGRMSVGTASFNIASDPLNAVANSVLNFSVSQQNKWQITSTGDFVGLVAGLGMKIKEGSNARMGTATLVNGTATVANTSITANTRVFLTRQAQAGTTSGTPSLGTVIAATSFVINSLTDAAAVSADDDSTIAWLLVEPSP